MMKIMAWRSGTGGVALAMNTDNSGDAEEATMDFCFVKYGDGKWYKSTTITQGERDLKAFQREIEIPPHSEEVAQQIRDYLLEISSTKVKMLTVSDLDFSWFSLWMYSLTSSLAAYASLHFAAPTIPSDDEIHDALMDVLDYCGLSRLLREGDAEETGTGEGDEEDNSEGENNRDVMTSEFVKSTVKSMKTIQPDDETGIESIIRK